jgi:hypothetical protein
MREVLHPTRGWYANGDRFAIAAEIVASRWGGSGRPLSTTTGRIHGETADHPVEIRT